jgi:hypothetical protein
MLHPIRVNPCHPWLKNLPLVSFRVVHVVRGLKMQFFGTSATSCKKLLIRVPSVPSVVKDFSALPRVRPISPFSKSLIRAIREIRGQLRFFPFAKSHPCESVPSVVKNVCRTDLYPVAPALFGLTHFQNIVT